MNNHNCRVCGFYIKDLPWGDDDNSPIYEICSCCGVEFGNEDYSIESVKRFRQEWFIKGTLWFKKIEKPLNWNLEEQLNNIPKDYK